jgi:phosphoribosyl-ATP pyrophosphohydrolase
MKGLRNTTLSKKITPRGDGVPDAISHRVVNGKSNGTYNTPEPSSASEDRRLRPSTMKSITASAAVLEGLCGALSQITATGHPRTFRLLQSSRRKAARKVIEEACEVTVEAVKRDADGVVRESADLLYHLVVLWFHMGIEPIEVWQEMQTRADTLGIAEKLPKLPGHKFSSEPNC